MRLVLDECVDRRLIHAFDQHGVRHVRDMGWHTLKNGQLLRTADGEFDVLVTVDRNMEFQSSLKGLKLAVIVVVAGSNRREDLIPLVPQIEEAAERIDPGTFIRIP